MNFTPSQQQVIDSRGNVVVLAGAGTGKTRTLVERTVRQVLNHDVSLDELLMVTFTEAAAAEMRHRIRQRLEEELDTDGAHERLREQLALLDTANISTLHSFCLQLVRQHFYDLDLDPQLTVLPEEQSKLLAAEVLDGLFEDCYAGRTEQSKEVLEFLQSQTQGWEKPMRDLILHLHDYSQTRPDPRRWRDQQLAGFAKPEPEAWRSWLIDGFRQWRELWLPALRAQPAENANAHACARILSGTLPGPGGTPRETIGEMLHQILAQDEWPYGTKKLRKPLDGFYKDAAFLHSLARTDGGTDPLTEDWNWVRGHMTTLLGLAGEFGDRFATAKREMGGLDFHDLEQFALRLLWDPAAEQPTPLAHQWRARFKRVFVDEYQDINAAQDCILAAVSREGEEANRFLVGDVKQSIYRFRQAAPDIFQGYAARWSDQPADGSTLPLSDNFRSHESLLEFINPLFRALMKTEIGGVDYDTKAELKFGNPEGRVSQRHNEQAETSNARVECHFLLKPSKGAQAEEEGEDEGDDLGDMSDSEQEARILAARLRQLHDQGHPIWDADLKAHRPVAWSDMMVLLRSPRAKVESYAREFDRAGIPLQARRAGFFDSIEVLDLVNLLNILDNPLQDVPVLAVLRSPLAGLSLDELAEIRLARKKVRFWIALQTWSRQSKTGSAANETRDKVHRFLERFARWRTMSRHASLSQRLETIVSETHYADWLLTLPRGDQRRANVQQFLAVARQFDELHNQGLYRFLRFLEARQEVAGDQEPAPLETEDAVRLTSIHQSKGLEFPVVAVADLGKPFNQSDTTAGILLDDHYGLCPQIKPPGTGRRYPSLPSWLARQRQRRESLGEELRLLYVALTRAQDHLILTGTCTAASAVRKWTGDAADLPHQILKARSYLDWIGPWLTRHGGASSWLDSVSGQTSRWRWRIHHSSGATGPADEAGPSTAGEPDEPAEPANAVDQLKNRIQWRYPFAVACAEPAKTSVTALRRRAGDELDGEAAPAPFVRGARWVQTSSKKGGLSAAAVGTAHHRFLQLAALDPLPGIEGLQSEAARLTRAGSLTEEEAQSLDLKAIDRFWRSEVGEQLRGQIGCLRREMPFTLRLTHEDLVQIGVPLFEEMAPDDFLVAQGVIDLAVMLPTEIWLLDFKTDRVKPKEVADKVKLYEPQVKLYSHALSSIHRKPVTHRWLHFLEIGRTVELK